MRRRALTLAALAALTAVPTAAAAFQPVRRHFGELTIPRLRAGTVQIPSGHASNRIRVIVTLKQPPLAQVFARGIFAAGSAQRLNVHTAASGTYLRRLSDAQAAAVALLHRLIPSATVSERYRIVLDGFTVTLPVKKLPLLARASFAQRVWPSLRYTQDTNRSPAVIGADAFHAATGDNGEGVKIGIVDDGVDNTNPFLSAAGFTAPLGFPIGDSKFTSAKVIVARAFPGPGSGAEGKLPLDRHASFHGTHVAGIAAGDAGTCSPGGRDHPPTCGLSGVAPRAFLGNYRVFNVPTPIGHIAESPEIAEAFEQAVADGMQVINFSGGGPQAEPLNDVLIPVVDNTAAAGVVPVIAAGNDREDFGFGTVGSPGTAPDAISVAAVSNSQVFAPTLTAFDATGKPVVQAPFSRGASTTPASWSGTNQTLVDVGSIVGRDGVPVERHLCGSTGDPNGPVNQLSPHSLDGAIALVSRGFCTFASKAQRAKDAGAIGIVIVDNRSGEANPIPIELPIPSGMVADIDGAALRAAMGGTGRIAIRVSGTVGDNLTNRSGIVTSFSSAGPTDFGHLLKPDISAPGLEILSSTLPEFSGGSPFAVFAGTSMATPHVTGAAALLVQRHPSWSPQNIKSALMSTAGPAWGNTARTQEASVTLEGAGLANVLAADDPQILTDPASLSFGDLDVNHGAQSRALLVRLADSGDGAGDWTVTLQPQTATAGTTVSIPSLVSIAPGGDAAVSIVARAAANATAGDESGFVVLKKGAVSRRIPYLFSVTRPALENVKAQELRAFVVGDTIRGTSSVSQYRFPSWAFGPPPGYNEASAPMDESGAEHLYTTLLSVPAINFGATILAQSQNSEIDPWLLGAPDENSVQGYAGTPVNVNSLMFDFHADVETAATVFPLTKRYYIAVDSGSDPFTGESLPGQYLLHAWVDDLTPPALKLITTRVAAGRPTVVARATDAQSGVDPLSLVLAYKKVLLGAALYDPASGFVIFAIPGEAPSLGAGKTKAIIVGSDNQETKNVNTIGTNVLPNTTFKPVKLSVVSRPAVTWLLPESSTCLRKTVRLLVVASSTKKVKSVTFADGTHVIGSTKTGTADLFVKDWNTGKTRKGKHILSATARDAAGRTFTATRSVRLCK